MEKTPDPALKTLRPTFLIAGAAFLIPVLAGILFTWINQRTAPRANPPATEALAALTNRFHDGSATNIEQLAALRRDLRGAGRPTDEIDLRLWAARAAEPECLFRVPPPAPGGRWTWHLSQEGLHALAVSKQADATGRRAVGLYDLTEESWAWTNPLPWPDTHEPPHVVGRRVILRYVKNATRFALEVDEWGRIAGIDSLGAGMPEVPFSPPAGPRFTALPCIAVKHNVFFTTDPRDGSLLGYANQPLPGLRHARRGGANTAFSGNGLLMFTAAQGRVTVADSLTQTVLQTFDAWPHGSNTVVTGTSATLDGSLFTVFLRTEFAGAPPVKRDWRVTIDPYTGIVKKDFSASAAPVCTNSLSAFSPDGRWRLTVGGKNDLTVAAADSGGIAARVPLASLALDLRTPIRSVAFLESGRHLVIRQDTNLWLLDFTAARAYGGLMARLETCSRTISLDTYLVKRATNRIEAATGQLAISSEGFGMEEEYIPGSSPFMPDPNATASSFLALRAEQFLANQSYGYAAALLEKTARLQKYDARAPQINSLLLARCQLLAGHSQKALATCRDALRVLLARPVAYDPVAGTYRSPANISDADTRIIRYHLQGLLFTKDGCLSPSPAQ